MSKNTKILLIGLIVLVLLFGGLGFFVTALKFLLKVAVYTAIGVVIIYLITKFVKKN
jgi:hypothetical protein